MILRWIWRSLLIVVLAPLVYLGADQLLSRLAVNSDFRPAENGVLVGIVSNGVHSDIILPYAGWEAAIPIEAFPGLRSAPRFLSFGWGNRDFYLNTPTWADFDLVLGLRAIAGIGETAVHVTARNHLPSHDLSAVFRVSHDQFDVLSRRIAESFRRSDTGGPILIEGATYTGADAFFEATGRYHLFRTCNAWTRDVLAEAGIRTPFWTAFPDAVVQRLREVL